MPRFALLFPAFLLAIGLSACTNPLEDDEPEDGASLIGSWKLTQHAEYDAPATQTSPAQHIARDMIEHVRFGSDHRLDFSIEFDYTAGSYRDTTIVFPGGTWSASGNALTITNTNLDGTASTKTHPYAINGSTLTLTDEEGSYDFTRE